jgi:hypothetical protein
MNSRNNRPGFIEGHNAWQEGLDLGRRSFDSISTPDLDDPESPVRLPLRRISNTHNGQHSVHGIYPHENTTLTPGQNCQVLHLQMAPENLDERGPDLGSHLSRRENIRHGANRIWNIFRSPNHSHPSSEYAPRNFRTIVTGASPLPQQSISHIGSRNSSSIQILPPSPEDANLVQHPQLPQKHAENGNPPIIFNEYSRFRESFFLEADMNIPDTPVPPYSELPGVDDIASIEANGSQYDIFDAHQYDAHCNCYHCVFDRRNGGAAIMDETPHVNGIYWPQEVEMMEVSEEEAGVKERKRFWCPAKAWKWLGKLKRKDKKD